MSAKRSQLKKSKPVTIQPRRGRNSLSRGEILDASFFILKSEGLDALSMRRIAVQLGCSVASPYAHFQNREEIIRELIALGERQLTADLKGAQATSTDVFVQLHNIARTYWQFATENRELHKIMFNMDIGKMYRKVFPHLPTSYRVFLETIRGGIRSGAIRGKNRRGLARTMWAWMYGLIVLDMGSMVSDRGAQAAAVEEGIEIFKHALKN
ncbi:MAG: TetR/AcrR family transcriptional regulator [Leptospirales bacterium]|nr:TetR/AcrR family transcriptional regulator [Leptospirales bacterium]